jgi:hypothetical protein
LSHVVPVACEIIAQAGVADRVSVQEGDLQRDDRGMATMLCSSLVC